MHYQERLTRTKGDEAVSPVVGVMLMLVVVIIIAAVVSGFSGGLIGTSNEKAPALNMDVKVINMGSWTGSGFYATVTSVSKPIPTKDIKIVTSWTATDEATGTITNGGNTTVSGRRNINYIGGYRFVAAAASRGYGCVPLPITGSATAGVSKKIQYAVPFGVGPGISTSEAVTSDDMNPTTHLGANQQFGNYTLVPGTTMAAQPCGQVDFQTIGGTWGDGNPSGTEGYGVSTLFSYTTRAGVTKYLDPTSALLGPDWEKLRVGDKVNVKIIHIPTGKVIFQKDIPVTEA